MLRDGHDGHLLANDESTAAERDENLAHDDEADVDARLAEVDHEGDTQDGHRHAEEAGQGPKTTPVVDHDTNNEGPEAGAYCVNVADIGRVGDGLVEDHDVQRVKVAVPNVPCHVERCHHGVGENHSAVLKQMPRDEGHGRKILLPETESNDEQTTEDEEADDEWAAPGISLVGVKREGEQEERQTGGQGQQADDIKLLGVEEGVLGNSATVRGDVN